MRRCLPICTKNTITPHTHMHGDVMEPICAFTRVGEKERMKSLWPFYYNVATPYRNNVALL